MGKEARVKKVVVCDMDGPINHGHVNSDKYKYESPHRSKGLEVGEVDLQHDFVVANQPFLKLAFNILNKNNIALVIGSQRIHMSPEGYQGELISDMYNGLDFVFGKNRNYLNEKLARSIGQKLLLNGITSGNSKNEILQAYKQQFNLAHKDVILIDDDNTYQEPAEAQGYGFVHAPRKPGASSAQDNAYIYETLFRTIPAHKIYKTIADSFTWPSVKNEFKKELLSFQLDNLEKVSAWQQKVLLEEGLIHPNQLGAEQLNPHEATAKQVLKGIQYLIRDTKWDIGLFGGEQIEHSKTGIKNTIPKGMLAILVEIEKADKTGGAAWTDALKKIEKIVADSAARKDHGLFNIFNKRGETTQLFYDSAKDMLSKLRKSHEEEPKLEEGPSNGPS